MSILSKQKVDFSQFQGPYPLLALLLLVVEAVLGVWFGVAEGSFERILIGLLMAVFVAAFLWAMLRVVSNANPGAAIPRVREVDEDQVKQSDAETIVGPDRSYIIQAPPRDWHKWELSLPEWTRMMWNVPQEQEEHESAPEQGREILLFRSPTSVKITPIPGVTKINGRLVPSALALTAHSQLSVVPVDRAQPPYFVERSLEQNFFVQLHALHSVFTMDEFRVGTDPRTTRRVIVASFKQQIERVIVDQTPDRSLVTNIEVWGIEGEIRDHLVVMTFVTLAGTEQPALEADRQVLRTLASSFRPTQVADTEAKRRQLTRKADEEFGKLIASQGHELFRSEFQVVLARLQDCDISDPADRLRAAEMLRPFEKFAELIQLDELDELWEAIKEADEGNATSLKQQLQGLLAAELPESNEVAALDSVSNEK